MKIKNLICKIWKDFNLKVNVNSENSSSNSSDSTTKTITTTTETPQPEKLNNNNSTSSSSSSNNSSNSNELNTIKKKDFVNSLSEFLPAAVSKIKNNSSSSTKKRKKAQEEFDDEINIPDDTSELELKYNVVISVCQNCNGEFVDNIKEKRNYCMQCFTFQ